MTYLPKVAYGQVGRVSDLTQDSVTNDATKDQVKDLTYQVGRGHSLNR